MFVKSTLVKIISAAFLLSALQIPTSYAYVTSVGPDGNTFSVANTTTVNLNSVLTDTMTVSGFPETHTVLAIISTTAGTLDETATA